MNIVPHSIWSFSMWETWATWVRRKQIPLAYIHTAWQAGILFIFKTSVNEGDLNTCEEIWTCRVSFWTCRFSFWTRRPLLSFIRSCWTQLVLVFTSSVCCSANVALLILTHTHTCGGSPEPGLLLRHQAYCAGTSPWAPSLSAPAAHWTRWLQSDWCVESGSPCFCYSSQSPLTKAGYEALHTHTHTHTRTHLHLWHMVRCQ